MNEALLLCRYSVGRTCVANSVLVAVSAAIKILSPAWDQQMYFWYCAGVSNRYHSLVTNAGQLALPPMEVRIALTAFAALVESIAGAAGCGACAGADAGGEALTTVGGVWANAFSSPSDIESLSSSFSPGRAGEHEVRGVG